MKNLKKDTFDCVRFTHSAQYDIMKLLLVVVGKIDVVIHVLHVVVLFERIDHLFKRCDLIFGEGDLVLRDHRHFRLYETDLGLFFLVSSALGRCRHHFRVLVFEIFTNLGEGFGSGEDLVYVVAYPKTEVARLTSITIKKVWNTDKSTKAADSITVQLLKNENVVKTATLNAQNNWQVTYDDMPESDAYSIKEVNVPKGFTATYKQNGYVFTVTNTSTLIQTGQLIWPISVLAMSGMLLIAIGILLLQKKRKSNA